MPTRTWWCVLFLTLVAAAGVLVVPVSSAAGADRFLKLTLVARQCDDYRDVMANRQRDNTQEALRDLGRDSVYRAGEAVSPKVEAAAGPRCRALPGWALTLGKGVNGEKEQGLSRARTAFRSVETAGSVPELDAAGRPTGESVAGAVTVTLTRPEVERALMAGWGALVVQGGTPSDPLNAGRFGSRYAFGALRCVLDNHKADNTELITFPPEIDHGFCFYYAVRRPPEYGTVVVRKEIPGERDDITFHYTGNVSYERGGRFALGVKGGQAAEQSFRRAATERGDSPWTVEETPLPGWRLGGVDCASDNGASTWVTNGPKVSITLAGDDTVRCTYRNVRDTGGQVNFYQQTVGDVGGPFELTMTRMSTSGSSPVGTVRTTQEMVPVEYGSLAGLSQGTYLAVQEYPEPTPAGFWIPVTFQCNGVSQRSLSAAPSTLVDPTPPNRFIFFVEVGAGPQNCLVTSQFVARGKVTLVKATEGTTGTADFVLRPHPGEPVQTPFLTTRSVATREVGVPVTAEPVERLALQSYDLLELPLDREGVRWRPARVVCDGEPMVVRNNVVTVALTRGRPHLTCVYTNTVVPERGGVRIEKTVRDPGGLRTGVVSFSVVCGRARRAFTVPVGRVKVWRSPVVRADAGASCTVAETGDGARDGTIVRTRVRGRRGDRVTVKVRAGRTTVVPFENSYRLRGKAKHPRNVCRAAGRANARPDGSGRAFACRVRR